MLAVSPIMNIHANKNTIHMIVSTLTLGLPKLDVCAVFS